MMSQRAASFIVDKRRWVLVIFLLLAAASVFTIGRVNINYDFTSYLSEDTLTYKSLKLMESEFGATDTVSVLLRDLPEGKATQLSDELGALDGAIGAFYDAESDLKYHDGAKYERVSIFIDDPDAVGFSHRLDERLSGDSEIGWYNLGGQGPQTIKVERKIAQEIPVAMLIAVIVVAGVLFLTSHSYIDPAVFAVVLIVSILINMGTNFIFGTISFITFAVCAILQLALAMDYSIMMLHSFFELRDGGMDDVSAVKLALQKTFMPICSSSLTTVAGLISLMFMSFTIGYDIGIVLSKGILISMISVFTLMPALILVFAKPLRTTMHKPLPLGGKALGRLAGTKWLSGALCIVLIGAIIWAAFTQRDITYTFMDGHINNAEDELYNEIFGQTSSLVLLVPSGDSDEDFDTQRALISEIEKLEYDGRGAIASTIALVTTGRQAVDHYTPSDVAEMTGMNSFLIRTYWAMAGFGESVRGDRLVNAAYQLMPENDGIAELKGMIDFAKRMFLSENYSRIMLSISAPASSKASYELVDAIRALCERFYPDRETGITGTLMSVYDISHAFSGDLNKVSLITIFAIFLIICVSFRSFVVPLILITVIQGAVWINIALSVPANIPVFFMCYLICLAMQMGATIDYGILLTSNYLRLRQTLPKREAVSQALTLSLPTIFTSGLILFAAGLTIGLVCTVYYIYAIGLLLASGTFFSLLMVLVLLPKLLVTLDRLIKKDR